MRFSQETHIENKSIITSPYWREASPRLAPAEQKLPTNIDVAIIGAGYTGLNVALVLARADVKVAVFEAGQLGSGASTMNGGMVGTSFHKLGVVGLKAKFGTDRANAILKESLGFVDFLESFLADEKIDANFSRVGRFRGALKAEHYDAMARELDSLKQAIDIKAAQRFFKVVLFIIRTQACSTGTSGRR
ncbi:MAG: glycine/D-amino acid oxidase-like deaminating enzyme [Granulosicoccus sp.]|jgi:glycine/D-amino acid oxidase-like deaminating enzyme